jgi:hypothetical protein
MKLRTLTFVTAMALSSTLAFAQVFAVGRFKPVLLPRLN